MKFKRNFKLYIKQKSTIAAFIFYIAFIVLTIISFIPSVFDVKGISESFNKYEVTYISTNNYTTTYAGSNNILFYSQNKSQNSTLNNFSNIQEYTNEYGSALSHPYNFIKIDYKFDSNIVKVVGISDNYLGNDGETLILTEKNYLYMISKRSKMVDYLLDNVIDVFAFYSRVIKNNIYIIKRNNISFLSYFVNNQINMYEIGNYSDCYLLFNENDIYKFVVRENNKISLLTISFKDEIKNTLKGYSYLVNEITTVLLNKEELFNNVSKIVFNETKIYLLIDKKCYELSLDFNINLIKCDTDIEDIYFTGENACIAICDDDLYYCGKLKYFKETSTFLKTNIKDGLLYGNRNSLIVYKNNKLYLYDENMNNFIIMYSDTILMKIMKIFNVFVVIMLTFYFILSFVEASERYNRYFSSSKNNKM